MEKSSPDKLKELSKEAVQTLNLADHYEVLIDSTLDKN